MNTETILVLALSRGLTAADFENMTLGMILDYVITYNNMKIESEDENIKSATQEDFDRFCNE
ncbi:hypothetical protein HXZ52_04175 [Clostridium cadaveris]|nr:hypothetical protein [Clostridium cadaveris]